jgi:hypothetical protein
MSREPETGPTRVMIVEDHADFRELMKVLLGSQPDIEFLAQAESLPRPAPRPRGSSWTWWSWTWACPTGAGLT